MRASGLMLFAGLSDSSRGDHGSNRGCRRHRAMLVKVRAYLTNRFSVPQMNQEEL